MMPLILPFWINSLVRTYALILLFANNGLINKSLLLIGVIDTPIDIYTRKVLRGKGLLNGLVFVLMTSPEIVLAILLLALFLLIAHITFCLPFVVITVFACLSSLDEHLLEAGRELSANESTMMRTVLIPVILPAVMAGWLLTSPLPCR